MKNIKISLLNGILLATLLTPGITAYAEAATDITSEITTSENLEEESANTAEESPEEVADENGDIPVDAEGISEEMPDDNPPVIKEEYTEKEWNKQFEKTDNSVHDLLKESENEGYGGYATYEEYMQSREADNLTQEQIDEGYVIIDGYIYSPEDLGGDTPSLSSGARPTATTGYVNFVSRVPEGIHEATYIDVINANTYEEYQAVMFEANGYATDICLPSGSYYVSDGGLAADFAGYYYVEKSMFTVEAGKTKQIRFDITDRRLTAEGKIHLYDRQNAEEQGMTYEDYVTSKYGSEYLEQIQASENAGTNAETQANETVTDTENNQDVSQVERENEINEEQEETKNPNLIATIIINILIFAPVVGFIIWYLRKRNRPEGFDE